MLANLDKIVKGLNEAILVHCEAYEKGYTKENFHLVLDMLSISRTNFELLLIAFNDKQNGNDNQKHMQPPQQKRIG